MTGSKIYVVLPKVSLSGIRERRNTRNVNSVSSWLPYFGSSVSVSIRREAARRMFPGFSQWYQARGNGWKFHLTWRRTYLLCKVWFMCRWLSTGTDWPEMLWSLPDWRYSRTICSAVPCAPGWSCLSREVRPDHWL